MPTLSSKPIGRLVSVGGQPVSRRRSLCSGNVAGLNGADCIHPLGLFIGFQPRFTRARCFRPYMETAVAPDPNLPRAPNALALAKPTIKNVVRTDVSLGPV